MASQENDLAASLTSNQRLVLRGMDYHIDSRRARTRARNDVRDLKLMYSEGEKLTDLGLRVRDALDADCPA